MANQQSRKDLAATKIEAAKIIRAALPDNLVLLFDELLTMSTFESNGGRGSPALQAGDYFWFHEDRLKRELEHARTNPPTRESRELLTVDEAAAYTQVHPSTIYRFIRRGELKAVRFGRLVRVDREDLEDLIMRSKTGDP